MKKTTTGRGGFGISGGKTVEADLDKIGPAIKGMASGIGGLVDMLAGEAIPKLVGAVRIAGEKLPATEEFSKQLDSVVKAFKIIGIMGSSMGELTEVARKMGTKEVYVGGKLASVTDMEGGLEALSSSFGTIAKAMKLHLKDLVQSVIDAGNLFTGIDPKELTRKMTLIGQAMGVIGDVSNVLGGVLKTFMKNAGGKTGGFDIMKGSKKGTGDPGVLMHNMGLVITSVVNNISTSLPKLINAVLGVEIKNPRAALTRMKIIGQAMAVVADFGSLVSDLMGAGTKPLPKGGEARDITALVTDTGIMIDSMGGKKGSLQKIVNAVQGLRNLKGVPWKMKMMGLAFKGLKEMGEALASLEGLGSGTDKLRLNRVLSPIEWAMATSTKYATVPGVLGHINALKFDFGKLKIANRGFLALNKTLNSASKAMTQTALADPKTIENILESLVQIKAIGSEVEAMSTPVTKVFKGGKLEVSHNVKKINMTVNVSIDSKALGKEIVKADVSGPKEKAEYLVVGPTSGMSYAPTFPY